MARYEFQQDAAHDDWVGQSSRLLNLIVRIAGLLLLGAGFIVALMVIASAWSLYENPARIESFAREIERGSNLDLTLSNAVSAGREQIAADLRDNPELSSGAQTGPDPGFRFSYFVAWLIAILLLLLIGRLSLGAVRTGGELALYDVKVGKLARALLQERMRAQ
jgi:hypothetical protein